jgi:hypothetical protein
MKLKGHYRSGQNISQFKPFIIDLSGPETYYPERAIPISTKTPVINPLAVNLSGAELKPNSLKPTGRYQLRQNFPWIEPFGTKPLRG